MKIEVLLADDHPILRFGVKELLASTPDLIAAGEASSGIEVLQHVRQRDWDLVVLDVCLPGSTGPDLIRQLRDERSQLRILVFTMHQEEQYALRAIRAGALGYVCKCEGNDLLLEAMRTVAGGRPFASRKVAHLLATDVRKRDAAPPHTRLTDREYGIFHRIVRGDRLTDIANELSLSVKTVSTHKTNILGKLTLGGPADLVRYAIEHKLLDTARD